MQKSFKFVLGQDFNPSDHASTVVASQLLSGFLAGVFGAMLNTPGDTTRTILQKRLLGGGGAAVTGATTLLGVGKEIVAARGIGGLYTGFKYKAFHLGGGGALMAFFLPFYTKLFDKL